MTYIERMCLASMVAAGHPVSLYSYDDIPDLPTGVALKDASEVLPRSRVIQHRKTGSWALFSDIFRYEGLRRGLGIWCDADVLLLRSLEGLGDHIVGWESKQYAGNAVLLLPPDSPFLAQMQRIVSARVPFVPYWSPRKVLQQALLRRPLQDLPRNVIGPPAITHYAKNAGLPIQPADVLFPIPYERWRAPLIPGYPVEDLLTERTRAVHLWNTVLLEFRDGPPPAGSFLARMCDRFLGEIQTHVAAV